MAYRRSHLVQFCEISSLYILERVRYMEIWRCININQNYEVAIVVRKEDYDQFHAAKDRYDLINEQDEVSPDHERITTSDILLGSPYGHTKIYEVEDEDNNSYIVYHGFIEWHAGYPPCDGYAAYDFLRTIT